MNLRKSARASTASISLIPAATSAIDIQELPGPSAVTQESPVDLQDPIGDVGERALLLRELADSDSEHSEDDTDAEVETVEPQAAVASKRRFDEFKVSKILQHRFERPDGKRILYGDKREFKVRWFNYRANDDTWEPESHFLGSKKLLGQYCTQNKLDPACPNPTVGAVSLGDPRNHARIDTIMETAMKFRQELKAFRSQLPIKLFRQGDQLADHDIIYLLAHKTHCYVFLYFSENDFLLEADGGNTFQDHEQEIRAIFGGRQIANIAYIGQRNIDHCASSAIIITLEFGRIHRKSLLPKMIYYQRRLKERLETALHQYDRVPISNPLPYHKFAFNDKCEFCGKGFKSRAKLTAHHNFCSKM